MPTAIPDLILCDAQTATGAGKGAIGFGVEMRYANGAGVNRNKYPRKFEVHAALTDTTTGATSTLAIQESADGVTYTTIATMALSLVSGSQLGNSRKGFTTKLRYIRGNVTAIAGGSAPTVNAYCTLGTW